MRVDRSEKINLTNQNLAKCIRMKIFLEHVHAGKKIIFGGVSFFDLKMQGLNLAEKEFNPFIVDDSGKLQKTI